MADRVPSTQELKHAESILQYLVRHPEAKTTREGIAMWWLQRQRIEQAVDEVYRGLELLVTRGLILERHGPDLRTYYEVNRERLAEVADWIQRAAASRPRSSDV